MPKANRSRRHTVDLAARLDQLRRPCISTVVPGLAVLMACPAGRCAKCDAARARMRTSSRPTTEETQP